MTRPSSRARSGRPGCRRRRCSIWSRRSTGDPRDRRDPLARPGPPADRRPRPRAGRGRVRRARHHRRPRRTSSGSSTSGLSREQRERIGPLPRGHGLLGLIIREAVSVRIPDIGADPRRYGFPPHHPPMRSFLGVPITVKGRPVGNLYLRNKRGAREFSAGRPGHRRDVRPPRRDRHRERPPPRAGPAHGGRRGARADRQGPPRRDHPGPLRPRPVARGRARAHGRRPRRGAGPDRPGDRRSPPRDRRHPQLHLRAAPGAARGGRPGRRHRGPRRRVPDQLGDRHRVLGGRRGATRAPAGAHRSSSSRSSGRRSATSPATPGRRRAGRRWRSGG